jgi:hypothetical protein
VFEQDTGVLRRFHAQESHELSERYNWLYVERLEASGPLKRSDYLGEVLAASFLPPKLEPRLAAKVLTADN